MTHDELKQEIAAVIETVIERTMKKTMMHGAWLLSNKYGLKNEQVKEWMQGTIDLTTEELEKRGLTE